MDAGDTHEDTPDAAIERPQTRRRTSLSDKQLAILEMIQRSVASRGYPPSMREIGDGPLPCRASRRISIKCNLGSSRSSTRLRIRST